jgi:putative ABC transport system ATP-binding protein
MSDQPRLAAREAVVRALRDVDAFRKGIWLTLFLILIGTSVNLVTPIYVQRIVDAGQFGGGFDRAVVLRSGGVAVVAIFAAATINRLANIRIGVAATNGLHELRARTFGRLQHQSILVTQEERRGALVSRVTNDIERIQEFMEWGGVGLLVGTGRVVITLIVMLWYSLPLAGAVIGATAVYAVMLFLFQRILGRAHDKARVAVADVLSVTGEAVSGMPIIRAYGAERHTHDKLDAALETEVKADFRASMLANALFATAETFTGLITAGVVALGIGLGLAGSLTAGELIAFFFLVALLVDPIQTMVETVDAAQSAGAGLRRIFEVLDTPIEMVDPGVDGTPLPEGNLGVEVRGLTFAYGDGPPVLHDVNVTIEPGERIAIVGETCSGKTTFAKLVARLMEAGEGEILLGGVPVQIVPFGSLRRRVGYVPQEGFLHDATVEENVRYGLLEATLEDIRQAFVDLELLDWVRSLPEGSETEVGERGSRLSAGERQLVALVRAWIRDVDLLLLDEATSAVDPALEVSLRNALNHLLKGRTSLTVAHRLSTAEASDRVLVFDKGRLVEVGTHDELLAMGGVYAHMHADWVAGTATV